MSSADNALVFDGFSLGSHLPKLATLEARERSAPFNRNDLDHVSTAAGHEGNDRIGPHSGN